ncbi:gamma-glutamylcyclotransferase family protein [Salicola sp. Rm-C-2C1-2]|uniref:gamma-glutamylcyclotransferase family protein n=1 Tax=Salicola sp. Rm-C-2C1-2 TaxID=3141321 RepID=UPI0032E44373
MSDDESTGFRIAVYGTLKRGYGNHRLLMRARFLGTDHLNSIVLHDLGPCPGAVDQPSQGIVVEVYEVDERTFERVDALEGYNARAPERGEYTRQLRDTRFGAAWVYFYNGSVRGFRRITRGAW